MEELDDITIGEFLTLSEEERLLYTSVLKHLKPKNLFAGRSINKHRVSYRDIMNCRHLIKTGRTIEDFFKVFQILFGVWKSDINGVKLTEFFSAQNFVVSYLLNLSQREKVLVKSVSSSVDSVLWEQAGGARLNPFSQLLPLVDLGRAFGLWPYDLQNRPYEEVFTLITALRIEAEVKAEFSRLKNK